MYAACLLAFTMGFLSLSQEVLWVRLFGFANHSLPQAFAFVLTMYLLGIALGAAIGKRVCERATNLWEACGYILAAAGLFDLIGPWCYADFSHYQHEVALGGIIMVIMAGLKAIMFPIAHYLGVLPDAIKVGRSVSKVYVANIVGATLGPIVTPFILLDHFSIQNCFAICALATFLMSLFCFRKEMGLPTLALSSVCVVLLASFIGIHKPQAMLTEVAVQGDIQRIVENRNGIVMIYKGTAGDDIVFGGNLYDGRTNLDPIRNSNKINRLLILAALQDKPENVLLVGLSIGTWLKLLTSFPGVKNIDVVEINPGYLTAIKDYPEQQSALQDPRVHVYIDDGRRWLRTQPHHQYDLIVMNTTWNWRAYTANLLSQEFLQILQQHMRPHALLAYNCTGSPYVLATAKKVFAHAYPYQNFVIAGDFDWRHKLHAPQAVAKLASLNSNGKRIFPPGSDKIIQRYLDLQPLPSVAAKEIITDDNLIVEYKYGKRL